MRVMDLFCGAGGASEGYHQAGFEIAVVADLWEDAIETHKLNHPDTEHYLINLVEDTDEFVSMFTPGEFDVIHGSPECKWISVANTRTTDPSKTMAQIHAFEKIVKTLKPQWWTMENVRTVLPLLSSFHQNRKLLVAADFGTPQTRIRSWSGVYPDPIRTHAEYPTRMINGDILEKWVSIKDALGEDTLHTSDGIPISHLVGFQNGGGIKGNYTRRSIEKPAFTITGKGDCIKLMPSGGRPGIGECRAIPRSMDKPSFTVTGEPGHLKKGDGSRRTLTIRECSILQGFPENYRFVGTRKSQYQQIGNAVPPQITKALGLAMKREVDIIS